jgi:hypothetical protein
MSSSPDSRNTAVAIAKHYAGLFPESYYTGDDFVPHEWVVQALLYAVENAHLAGYERGKEDYMSYGGS